MQVIARLTAEGLASDERFSEQYARARMSRGYGPVRICHELRQRGISEESSAAYLDMGEEWQALAADARQRRFGADQPGNPRERARQIRFLEYRGFTRDQIQYALNAPS